MADNSKIEWTDATWNPITGCTPVSEGCEHCYAARMAKRLAGRCGYQKVKPFGVTVHQDRFDEPKHWRKPRRVFVCSMGDLFHEDVPKWTIVDLLRVMRVCECHTFMLLTKQPKRAQEVLSWAMEHDLYCWPLPNVWLGVTAENQRRAEERIPILLQIPAPVRFVSVEPMLGPVNLYGWSVDWVICGGETGPGARGVSYQWVSVLKYQCADRGIPFFFKSWGASLPYGLGFVEATHNCGRRIDGREWNEFPRS